MKKVTKIHSIVCVDSDNFSDETKKLKSKLKRFGEILTLHKTLEVYTKNESDTRKLIKYLDFICVKYVIYS